MTAPSWPQLVGWLQTPRISTARGRWHSVEDGKGDSGTFAYRAPNDWVVRGAAGAHVRARGPQGLWQGHEFERDDDYHRAAGPAVEVHHDGRRCWQVQIEPPPRKRGLLTLVVDDETGLCLRMANEDYGFFTEVVELELDVDLPAETFAPLLADRAEQQRVKALYELTRCAPPPTPCWFPWRRSWVEQHGCRALEDVHGEATVARAPLGVPAPASEFVPTDRIVRFDHHGWSWAVTCAAPLTETTARRVVEQLAEDPSG